MRPDFWFGLAITMGGVAVMAWAVWGGPWMTRVVWDENGYEWAEYFAGDVSREQLVKGGSYQATHLTLKSRTVMRPPAL